MEIKTLRKALAVAVLALTSGYTTQASALPLEPFSFHQSSGFLVDNSLLSTTGNNNIGWYNLASSPMPPTGEFNTLAWGRPVTNAGGGLLAANPFTADPGAGNITTDLSGIRVLGHAGTITTGAALGGGSDWGAWASISTVYHQNRAIDATASFLVSSILQSILTLDHSPEGDIGSNANPVNIGFNETFNAVDTGVCPAGNPLGSLCDDLFTFNLDSFAPISFPFGGHNYEVQFQLGNFSNSFSNYAVNVNPACPDNTCTIWTAENVTSSLDVQARIRQLPEPATLALFGIGLLGLGFAKRRQLKG